MKRKLTGFLAATLAMGSFIPAAFADTTATDVDGSANASAIQEIMNLGIINPYKDGTFQPSAKVTRGQFVSYIYTILSKEKLITLYRPKKAMFKDVGNGIFSYNQVNTMAHAGFAKGLGNGSFGQGWTVPATYAAEILLNVLKKNGVDGTDFNAADPYAALNVARNLGLFDGTPQANDLQSFYLNRSQAAQVLENFYVALKPDALSGVAVSLQASAASDTASVGATDAITVTAQDPNGNAVDNVSGVKFRVVGDNASDATVDDQGNFKATKAGSYTVQAYIDDFLVSNDVAITVADQTLAVTGNSDLSVGGKDTLGVTADGTAVTSGVTWSVDGNGAAVVDANGNFVASAAGTYNVTATYNGQTATAKVVVYGQAAGVQIKPANPSVVANGQSTDSVTVTVVDANGNAVKNYNGTLTIGTTGGAVSTVISDAAGDKQPTDFAGTTLTVANGVGTFLVQAGSIPGLTSSVSASALTAAAGSTQASTITYGSGATINTVAQTPTAISVTPKKSVIEVNDNSDSSQVSVQVNDQTGNPMLGGTYVLTGSIAGGGTFADGTTSNEAIVVSAGQAATAVVKGVQGKVGTYAISVSGANLTAGSGSITASVAGNAARLAIAPGATTSFVEGSGTVTGSVYATDGNGVPVTTPGTVTPEVFVTDSYGNAVTNWTISGHTAGTDGGYSLGVGASTFTISDVSGKADAGTYNVVVKDAEATGALSPSANFTVTETAGVAAKLSITTGNNVLGGSSLSTPVTIQVTDASGNPIATSGQTVSLSVYGNGLGSSTVNGTAYSTPVALTTDASGKATATFASQDYNGAQWTLQAVATGFGTPVSTKVYVNDHPSTGYTFGLVDTANSNNTVFAKAGDTVNFWNATSSTVTSLANAAVDAYGNSVTSAVYDNITVTFNHASGLAGLPTTSTSTVTVASNTTNDTETLTGSLGDVSSLLGSSTLKAAKAGTVTVNVTDNSTGARGSASINVSAVNDASAVGISGLSNNGQLTVGTLYPVTVSLVDAGGNPVVAAHSSTVTLTSSDTNVKFENSTYAPTNTVTLAAGQTSVTVYVVATAATSSANVSASVYDNTVGSTVYSGTNNSITGLSAH